MKLCDALEIFLIAEPIMIHDITVLPGRFWRLKECFVQSASIAWDTFSPHAVLFWHPLKISFFKAKFDFVFSWPLEEHRRR